MMMVNSMILLMSSWKLKQNSRGIGLFQDLENVLQVSTSEF